eukprot:4651992-Prymnesium_polylepis.1
MADGVDERCRQRCTDLAESLADCEREHPGRFPCKSHHKRWRDFCVTNSACNPAGRLQDPQRAEKRCAALAKRAAICSKAVDRKAAPSATADCEEQRKRWRSLCDSVRVNEEESVDERARSQAITQAYREAAARESEQPEPTASGAVSSRLMTMLGGRDSAMAGVIYSHPFKLVVAISSTLCGAIGYRGATDSATAGLPLTQRLVHMRVYGQAVIVLTT